MLKGREGGREAQTEKKEAICNTEQQTNSSKSLLNSLISKSHFHTHCRTSAAVKNTVRFRPKLTLSYFLNILGITEM